MSRSLLTLALVLTACPSPPEPDPTPIPDPEPGCIEVEASNLDFGGVDVRVEGASASAGLTVRNTCDGLLRLSVPRIDGTQGAAFEVQPLERTALRQDEATELRLTFQPTTVEPYSALLSVLSNDPEAAEVEVFLEGRGEGPRIRILPEATDFGAPLIGCEQNGLHSLANIGTAPLDVERVELLSASESFSIDTDPLTNGELPFSLEAEAQVEIYLDYLPLDETPEEAVMAVFSSDPVRPRAEATAVGTGTPFSSLTDTFEVPLNQETDLLFTIDRSCSLDDANRKLASSMGHMVDTLKLLDADFHLAAVTADQGCIVGEEPFIDGSFSASDAQTTFLAMSDLGRTLSAYGANEERGFSIATAALDATNREGSGCNADFYREDAFLSITSMSDEAEQSTREWSHFVALFQALKADPERVQLHAIAGDLPTGCGEATAGTGYYEATVATGGLFLSYCASDWEESLEDIAIASVPDTFDAVELTQQPVPQTLEVRVDGVVVGTGWEYDIGSNRIVFDAGSEPLPGSTIEVHYERMPRCER